MPLGTYMYASRRQICVLLGTSASRWGRFEAQLVRMMSVSLSRVKCCSGPSARTLVLLLLMGQPSLAMAVPVVVRTSPLRVVTGLQQVPACQSAIVFYKGDFRDPFPINGPTRSRRGPCPDCLPASEYVRRICPTRFTSPHPRGGPPGRAALPLHLQGSARRDSGGATAALGQRRRALHREFYADPSN